MAVPKSPPTLVDIDLTKVKIEGRSNVASDINLKSKKGTSNSKDIDEEQLMTDMDGDFFDWADTI